MEISFTPVYAQIGIGGHRLVPEAITDGRIKRPVPIYSEFGQRSLRDPVPFRVFYCGEDLPGDQQHLYGLRREWHWRGEHIIAYFAKALEQVEKDFFCLRVTPKECIDITSFVAARSGYSSQSLLLSELGIGVPTPYQQPDGWHGWAVQKFLENINQSPFHLATSDGGIEISIDVSRHSLRM